MHGRSQKIKKWGTIIEKSFFQQQNYLKLSNMFDIRGIFETHF